MRKVEQKMKKTIFEEMGGTYVRCGDYFIPNLTLPEEEELYIYQITVQSAAHHQIQIYIPAVFFQILQMSLSPYSKDISEIGKTGQGI